MYQDPDYPRTASGLWPSADTHAQLSGASSISGDHRFEEADREKWRNDVKSSLEPGCVIPVDSFFHGLRAVLFRDQMQRTQCELDELRCSGPRDIEGHEQESTQSPRTLGTLENVWKTAQLLRSG